MFPADCLPPNYIEARSAASKPHPSSLSSSSSSSTTTSTQKPHNMSTTTAKPLLLQPAPKRPSGPLRTISCPPRTLSSALSNLFPVSGVIGATAGFPTLGVGSVGSSARNSPAATPMPSPGLGGHGRGGWFGVGVGVGVGSVGGGSGGAKTKDQDITCLPPAWS